jgi:hypothetical protein
MLFTSKFGWNDDVVFWWWLEILELWKNGDAVCFDVDSTVCLDEGIDELAEFCGAGKAVAEWTARLDFLNWNSFLEKGLCFFLISVVFSIYNIWFF